MSGVDTALTTKPLALRLPDRAALALVALFALGAAVIWAAPRPQMIDLPQHAAQVALLHDLLLGRSPWAGDVRINLATPYLIGYGLALPLTFLMSAGAALKTVLTLAYGAFIAVCVGLGRELGASRKLEAYYAFSFFGFAFIWGMYTFLVAAPVGLGFIWLCVRYARQGTWRQGLGVAALGLALLLSHGLVFLFACGIGGLILLVRARSLPALIVRSWPFWILLLGCAAIFVLTRTREAATTHGFGAQVDFGPWQAHLACLLINAFDAPYGYWPIGFLCVFLGLPLLAGFRLDWSRREAVVILGASVGAVLFTPHYAWSTSLLYPRFALFLPPAYAWLLQKAEAAPGSLAVRLQPRLGLLAGTACAVLLGQHVRLALAFGQEQRDFESVLAAAAPGQRALALILDSGSRVDKNRDAYVHHALWYQADKRGFVDFNFAVFHPEIVRFRPGHFPAADERFAQEPWRFNWRTYDADRYRYFFVRGGLPNLAFPGAPCQPAKIAAAGTWRLYERRACPTA